MKAQNDPKRTIKAPQHWRSFVLVFPQEINPGLFPASCPQKSTSNIQSDASHGPKAGWTHPDARLKRNKRCARVERIDPTTLFVCVDSRRETPKELIPIFHPCGLLLLEPPLNDLRVVGGCFSNLKLAGTCAHFRTQRLRTNASDESAQRSRTWKGK